MPGPINLNDVLRAVGDTSDLEATGHMKLRFATGITAAGTIITDATDLNSAFDFHNITTAAASTGVQLPVVAEGVVLIVRNSGANTVNVFPSSGTDVINALSAGAAHTLATTITGVYIRISPTLTLAYRTVA